MKIDYSGKIVIVTGAGGGIGRASALLFARLGASVVVSDINEESLKETAESIVSSGGIDQSIVADVTNAEEAAGIVKFACSQLGGLDVLFNNAGGSFPRPMAEISRDEFLRLRALNFDGVYHASMEALPVMVEKGGGVILSTTSGAGAGAVPGLAVYGAAKAGVNSLMRSIAIEYGRKGIRANAIAPSAATPGLIEWLETLPGGVAGFAEKQPMGRLGTPEDIASVAAFLASDYASFVNGAVIPVDGGIEAMLAVPT
jgi:NAD(P)-dependent dehydrogenase (short-subunit alcohol dehydrogenase family)